MSNHSWKIALPLTLSIHDQQDSSGIVLSNPSLLTGLLAAGAVAFAL
jgi:hypothetical protein